IIVTAKSSSKDFKSRVFGPWCGIPEDPVTGSAHTVLAPFWADKLGKKSFSAQQCSQRSGDLEISIISDTHVAVSGRAVTVIEGTINV
ncbi:phenazine biosynthesis PhzC/PhzF protein, partial [Martensiomyces pterosporus]